MTAGQQAAAGAMTSWDFTITIASLGSGGAFGYAIAPATNGAGGSFTGIKRRAITEVASPNASIDFRIDVSGSPLQTSFSKVIIQDGAGNLRTYLTNSLNYFNPNGGGGFASWNWGTGSSPVYVIGDIGKVRSGTLYL